MNGLLVRKAGEPDIPDIHTLLEHYADLGIVLRRSREDIKAYLGNFFVVETEGKIVGCSAVRDFGNDLLEIRSLVISPEYQKRGIGRKLVGEIIRYVDSCRPRWRLFTLTGEPEFFGKVGFATVAREMFPEKIWSDCRNCPKNDCCDEVALMLASEDYRSAASQR